MLNPSSGNGEWRSFHQDLSGGGSVLGDGGYELGIF